MDASNVLIVEDEPELAEAYAVWVGGDYTTETVYNGEDALNEVGEDTDIVFLDRGLPDKSGDEVLAEIRERGHDCWVVIVTGNDPNPEFSSYDFDAFLSKPVDREEVETVLETIETRSEYHEVVREYTAVQTRLDVLYDSIDDDRKTESEFYQDLIEREERLEERMDELEGEFEEDPPEIDAVTSGIST